VVVVLVVVVEVVVHFLIWHVWVFSFSPEHGSPPFFCSVA